MRTGRLLHVREKTQKTQQRLERCGVFNNAVDPLSAERRLKQNASKESSFKEVGVI
jgi:hypothetical protein